ncbi:MAG: 4-hydroxy-tetrahydrodipicolinate reductase [Gammaproteobacteria bacterium]|nr:4-hydroxy-tetrahydrodipicolinate reductase [Gammaproteobacteria bacterium]MYF27445.1 4-hydroxy-tetrahydrodipicolinate reductase [Gammaproteobacteria bacterium]MYK45668.1 4-hydroxy-tetrahydrodipicolinate reductase [Gammaproteobacteria bacterium]
MRNASAHRVAVAGAAGRMGRMLVSAITRADDLRPTGAVDHPDAAEKGADAGELAGVGRLGVPIVGNIAELAEFDVLVDFSVATATLDKLDFCTGNGKAMVIGTTGFEEAGLDAIRQAAQSVPIVMAPNMSVGVNVAFKLIEFAARALRDDVDVEVFEAHHRHKIDAPSGTAVRMGEILARTLERDIATDAVYGREGITGEREGRTIGFHSLRGGDIVGEHTVTFAGTGERIEITHRAGSRENFAAGAVRAVRFVAAREPGLYGMDEVLGL